MTGGSGGGTRGHVTVVRADAIGDALLTLPLLAELVGLPTVTAVQYVGHPAVRRILEVNLPDVRFVDGSRLTLKAAGLRPSLAEATRLLRDDVRPFGPEVVISPRSEHVDPAVYELVRRSGARRRIGYVGPRYWRHPGPISRPKAIVSSVAALIAFDERLRPDLTRHDASLSLSAAEPIGGARADLPELRLGASPEARARVAAAARPTGVRVVLAPEAGARKRDWPLERYAEVLRALHAATPISCTVVAAPGDDTLAARVQELSGVPTDAVPAPQDLDTALAVMLDADLFLGADSGPAHLAGFAGMRGVVVSCHPAGGDPRSPNAPNRFRPLNGGIEVVQPPQPTSPCTVHCRATEPHCILGVSADTVIAALRPLLPPSAGPGTVADRPEPEVTPMPSDAVATTFDPAEELARLCRVGRRRWPQQLDHAAQVVADCLRAGGTVFTCGNGGSAAESLHVASELTGRFRGDRASLPAVALVADVTAITAIGNDFGFDRVFERQLEGLGRSGDVLVALSTSGGSPNIVRALQGARQAGIATIGLLPPGSAGAAECDVVLEVSTRQTDRAQELHLLLLHSLCERVEVELGMGEHIVATWHPQLAEADRLAEHLDRLRPEHVRIGWTNGCFDVLHRGHVDSLRSAAERCDFLVVGLNTDDSVRRLKGESRPLNSFDDRAESLLAMRYVDAVVAIPEDTPEQVLARLRPDVVFKGAEYESGKPMPEAELVRGYGGAVEFLPMLPGRSTTGLIEKAGGPPS